MEMVLLQKLLNKNDFFFQLERNRSSFQDSKNIAVLKP